VPRIEHPEFAARDETIASVMLRDYDRLASNSGATADIPGLPFWANSRSSRFVSYAVYCTISFWEIGHGR
jgi:hypothetical protein